MDKNRIIVIIPSRLQSTRLPEKPLKDISGKTLVQRAWECAKGADGVGSVVVATDNETIADVVRGFGGEVIMTDPALANGSERVRAAAELLAKRRGKTVEDAFDVIVNVQGDMPFLPSRVVQELAAFLWARKDRFSMATIAAPIVDREKFLSPSVVKVVVTKDSEALYFSRAPVPFPRNEEDAGKFRSPATGEPIYGLHHYGLYAFTPKGMRAYETSEISPLEQMEKLEQLRVLERGDRVGVLILGRDVMSGSVEVDTAEDLERARKIAK